MDDRDWRDKFGLDPDKQHRRLAPLWNPWEDCPSASAIEWTHSDGDETACEISVPGLGKLIVVWRGHKLIGSKLKGE